MADIHVDPFALKQAAAKLSEVADRAISLAEEATQSAAAAPSYDGQFGNRVRSMGAEAQVSLGTAATRMSALSDFLLLKAEEFEAADRETLTGLLGLLGQVQGWIDSLIRPKAPPGIGVSPLFQWLFQDDEPPPEEGDREPWYGPLALELSKAWNWYHQNVNERIYERVDAWRGIGENARTIAQYYMAELWFAYDEAVNEPVRESVETWRGNAENARTIVLYSLAQLWFGYDKTVNQPIYGAIDDLKEGAENLRERAENLNVKQGPGPDPTGPLAPSLAAMSATDAAGNPISIVGTELADMIEQRGVDASFVPVNFGVVPWEGRVVLPEHYAGAPPAGEGNVGFVAHEFTHVVERDLADPTYWPTGDLSLVGARIVGDSTNYMEVVSNIVGLTVEYDLLSQSDPTSTRLDSIQNELATYADADAFNATRYLVSESWDPDKPGANAIYRANYAHELTVADHRIPDGGWDYWLKEMGFSDKAVHHIADIASRGSAKYIDPATLDTQTGKPVTPAPATSTPTPTATATSTSTPTPTPTASPTSSPTPTATPSPPPPSPTEDEG